MIFFLVCKHIGLLLFTPPPLFPLPPVDSFSIDAGALLAKHQRGAEMTPEEITAVLSKHNMVTWNAGGAVNQLQVSGGEGTPGWPWVSAPVTWVLRCHWICGVGGNITISLLLFS